MQKWRSAYIPERTLSGMHFFIAMEWSDLGVMARRSEGRLESRWHTVRPRRGLGQGQGGMHAGWGSSAAQYYNSKELSV